MPVVVNNVSLTFRICFLYQLGPFLRRPWNISRQSEVGHVLYDHQPELIASSVEKIRLDLDVLSDHVEPEVFQHLQIIHHRFVGRRGVYPVRPVPLA